MTNIKVSEKRHRLVSRSTSYWTTDAIANAEPIPLRTAPKSLLSQTPVTDGRSRVVPGNLPRTARRQLARTVEVANYSQFPFSCVGKLLMREGSNNFVGSAWMIGKQAILTAAHCLFDDNGTFFDDVIFIPQFDDGSEPLGRSAVVQMAIDQRYVSTSGDSDLRFDMGIAILDRPIGDDTGTVSFKPEPTSEIALGAEVTGCGYPADPPFDGSDMFKSTGPVVRDSAPGSTTERFFGAENDMTGGCSGGPWFDPSGVVIGLNSFVFVGESPRVMHSPYFGQGFQDLVQWGRDNGGFPTDGDGDHGIAPPPSGGTDTTELRAGLTEVVAKLSAIIEDL